MKPGDMVKWQVFRNSNGYLSLVYKIAHGNVHVINYNGSVYKLSKDSIQQYKVEVTSATKFVREFPERVIANYEQAKRVLSAIKVEVNGKPLFITHDGVHIFKGMDYWVYDSKMERNSLHPVYNASSTHNGNGKNRTYFYEKSKAQEFMGRKIEKTEGKFEVGDILEARFLCYVSGVRSKPGELIKFISKVSFKTKLKSGNEWSTASYSHSEGPNSQVVSNNFKLHKGIKIKPTTMSQEALLEQAKRNYPKGTTCYPVDVHGKPLKSMEKTTGNFDSSFDGSDKHIWSGVGYLYARGKWAEIVSTPKESVSDFPKQREKPKSSKPKEVTIFTEGTHIILVEGINDTAFKNNHIYKQKIAHDYLMSELDSNGSRTNGWSRYSASDNSNWRYATPREVDEYNRLGRPYDVTTLDIKKPEPKYMAGQVFQKKTEPSKLVTITGFSHLGADRNGEGDTTPNYDTNDSCEYTEDFLDLHFNLMGSHVDEPGIIHSGAMSDDWGTTGDYMSERGIELTKDSKSEEDLEFQTPVIISKGTKKTNKLIIIKN